jgi:hypothetical protein
MLHLIAIRTGRAMGALDTWHKESDQSSRLDVDMFPRKMNHAQDQPDEYDRGHIHAFCEVQMLRSDLQPFFDGSGRSGKKLVSPRWIWYYATTSSFILRARNRLNHKDLFALFWYSARKQVYFLPGYRDPKRNRIRLLLRHLPTEHFFNAPRYRTKKAIFDS